MINKITVQHVLIGGEHENSINQITFAKQPLHSLSCVQKHFRKQHKHFDLIKYKNISEFIDKILYLVYYVCSAKNGHTFKKPPTFKCHSPWYFENEALSSLSPFLMQQNNIVRIVGLCVLSHI